MLIRILHVVTIALLAPVATGLIPGIGSGPKRFPTVPSFRTLTVDSPRFGTAINADYLNPTTESNSLYNIYERARRANLLDDALGFNSTAATELLDEFDTLRKSRPLEDAERFVNDLIETVDGLDLEEYDKPVSGKGELPWWTMIPQTAWVSRRARLASLRRVLDMSTPAAGEKESVGDEAAPYWRRRALMELLHTLANTESKQEQEEETEGTSKSSKSKWTPAIAVLEGKARQGLVESFTVEDMESRLPPGAETPNYSLLVRKKAYEIRSYEPFSVCSVGMVYSPHLVDSDAKIFGEGAFGALNGYFFGKNLQLVTMKRTTPILTEGQGQERTMSFVLPSKFWKYDGLQRAPQPMIGSGVQLLIKEPGETAVIMFGGFASKRDVERKEKELLRAIARDGDWVVKPGSSVMLAEYNDPIGPPWKRRNEVSISVVPKENESLFKQWS